MQGNSTNGRRADSRTGLRRAVIGIALVACGPSPAPPVGPESPPAAGADSVGAEPAVGGDDSSGREADAASAEPAARPVELSDLVTIAAERDAYTVETMLGDLKLAVRCEESSFVVDPSGQIERGSCPAGLVAIGGQLADLEVAVTRRVDDPLTASANLALVARGEGAAWLAAMRRELEVLRDRDELEKIVAEDGVESDVFHLGSVKAVLHAAKGDQLARLVLVRPVRALLR